jgi:hypothetical protein
MYSCVVYKACKKELCKYDLPLKIFFALLSPLGHEQCSKNTIALRPFFLLRVSFVEPIKQIGKKRYEK